jgi:hypothetical protein
LKFLQQHAGQPVATTASAASWLAGLSFLLGRLLGAVSVDRPGLRTAVFGLRGSR